MARIKIDKVNEYFNTELLDVFPDEAKVEKYWNGERVEVQE